MKSRNLTKSRFKVGYECPTKLYYLDNKEYGSNNEDDAFLRSLAEGGFQVGELAKLYYEGGVEITTDDKAEAVRQTAELMAQENATIFEAAFQFENLYVKVDVLVKKGKKVELIEVKAKSFDADDPPSFFDKRKTEPSLVAAWEPYVLDVAFQGWVFAKCYPKLALNCFLMMANKSAEATVDGLNQNFLLCREADGRSSVKVREGLAKKDLGRAILAKLNVQDCIETIWGMEFRWGKFPQMVAMLSKVVERNEYREPVLSKGCKACEYRIKAEAKAQGLRSGFEECWKKVAKLKDSDFVRPFVFDVWKIQDTELLIEEGIYFIDQMEDESCLKPKSRVPKKGGKSKKAPTAVDTAINPGEPLSTAARQWLQVVRTKEKSSEAYFDRDAVRAEMATWRFPLHFIDFETARVAIPFHAGRRPYEQIAFQFSHHQVDSDGKIEHKDDFLFDQQGKFPNFEFIRALKEALSRDEGTIFRYSHHENSVLNDIYKQLEELKHEVKDYRELQNFIATISTVEGVRGIRSMVDLCALVQKFYFNPATGGSNSIKYVLPSVLEASSFLQEKYAKAIYGAKIKSRNFGEPVAWIKRGSDGKLLDPYKGLSSVFQSGDLAIMGGRSLVRDRLNDGGAAMTAFARMQFTEMSNLERDRIRSALLRYCELDTLAMVMLYEHWANELGLTKAA